ncbi:MAG: hypothetical protein K8T90_15645 [Planctomycetes bacterium]|nr:hypothetical protein [Planctomycetota bacterium]
MKTIAEFIEAYRRVEYWWHALDEPILELCSRHPEHTDPRIVFGKIALVNRAYRANVQMGTRNAEWKLAEAFVVAGVDAALDPLRAHDRLTAEARPDLFTAHARLVAVARDATGRVTESFCSKYLSFHFPQTAPLFDGIAEQTAKRLPLADPGPITAPNARYRAHCHRVLELIEGLRASGVADPDVKRLDYVLYNPGGVEGQA